MVISTLSVGAHPEVKYDFRFGSFGSTDGLFNRPIDVEVYNNSLFVSDNGNDRIQKFDLQGNFIASFGGTGSGATQLDYPGQIAINSTTVMVADYTNHRIQMYDHNGAHIGSFGSNVLVSPWGIATDNKHIYVSDYLPFNIKMFDMSGNLVKNITMKMSVYPYFLGVTQDYLYAAGNYYSSGVDIYDLTGNYVANMSSYTYGRDNYGLGNTKAAYGIHITDNRIYVSDYSLNKINIYDRNNKFEYELSNADNLPHEMKNPAGMGSSATHLYIADSGNNQIQAFSIIPETVTVTDTVISNVTISASNGILPSSLPFDFQFFTFSLILIVPIVRFYRKRKETSSV